MTCDRRGFIAMASAGAAAAASPRVAGATTVGGVELGVQSYCFHEIPNDGVNHVDALIRDIRACRVNVCELFAQQVAPGLLSGRLPPAADCPDPMHACPMGKGGTPRNPFRWVFASLEGDELVAARARQKQWNETVSMDYFRDIRRRMNDAGIEIRAYNIMLPPDVTDLEIDRFFQATKALGARTLMVSTRMDMLARMAPFAEKNQVYLSIHGHGMTWDRQEVSDEASFEAALALSPWMRACLDIGHYAAHGGDPVAFIQRHHDRVSHLHLRDRRANTPGLNQEDGLTVAWGQGVSPIKDVLLALQRGGWPIPAFVEYDYAGTDLPLAETIKNLDYARRVLTHDA